MRKLTGWLLIIFCSLWFLIFGVALVAILPGLLKDNSDVHMSATEIFSSIVGFVVVITLLIFGLRAGIKRIKKVTTHIPVPHPDRLEISFSGKIDYRNYRNLILELSFKRPIYLVALGILVLYLLTYLTSRKSDQTETQFLFILLGVIIVVPIITLTRIKKIYNTTKIFHEQMNYHITNESIHIKGETVDSTQKWDHFIKIKETKNFFMLYQTHGVATFLEKKMFSDKDANDFREFLKSLNVALQ